MREIDATCKGCPISREAITTALSNLQQQARADARDEQAKERA
jgi:NADH:ubiquinone oxidoreductase subunit B-like Fe-S oxidoreductase